MGVNRILIRLSGLLGLIVISYAVAQLLVSAWLPAEATRLVLGIPLLALVLPVAYWVLARRYEVAGEIPYFLLPLDFLLPLSILPTVLLIIVLITPRFAVWQWGSQGTGTVQALSIEEDLDSEFGRTRRYRVDYSFGREGERSGSHTSYISQALFKSLQPQDEIAVHYVARVPGLVTAGDPVLFGWQATVLTCGTMILLLWLSGAAVATSRRHPLPSVPALAPPHSAIDLLRRYGLDALLGEADDAELWAAVIHANFPMPEDEAANIAGLRFGTGAFAPEARLKLQPLQAWCFARVDTFHLKPVECAADQTCDADLDPALSPTLPLLLLYLDIADREMRPLCSVVIPRPTVDERRVPVYSALCRASGNAFGETAYWERLEGGRWQHTGQKLNWWMEGA